MSEFISFLEEESKSREAEINIKQREMIKHWFTKEKWKLPEAACLLLMIKPENNIYKNENSMYGKYNYGFYNNSVKSLYDTICTWPIETFLVNPYYIINLAIYYQNPYPMPQIILDEIIRRFNDFIDDDKVKFIKRYPYIARELDKNNFIDNQHARENEVKKINANQVIGNPTQKVKKKKIKPQKRKKPYRTQKIERFVKFLIENNHFTTYQNFYDDMTTTYLYESGDGIENKNKFNEHNEVKNVYCIRSKKTKANILKNPKFLVHFCFENGQGHPVSQEPYSLSSFKKIFDKVRLDLNKIA